MAPMNALRAAYMALWRLGWKWRARGAGGLQVGDIFPDFSLRDLKGESHRLSDFSVARYTALWFTNLCEDCRNRIPLLEELRREAGDRVRVLAVSILDKDDPLPGQIGPSCSFPILLDPEDIVGRRLGLPHPPKACPFHNFFVVSRSGEIEFRHHLSAIAPNDFESLWGRLLKKEERAT